MLTINNLFIGTDIVEIERIKNVIVGGGPVQNDLKRKILSLKNRIFETYGMTESLTHVAIKNLTNNEKNFHALEGITFAKKSGCLLVNTPHLSIKKIQTNDEINLLSKTEFSWLGRKDFIINSGGVKINPEELEKKLNESYDQNFVISSIADEKLGQKLVIVFEKKIPENWIKGVEKLEKISLREKREDYGELQQRLENLKNKYRLIRDQKIRERVEALGVKTDEADDRSALLQKEKEYNLARQKIEFALESFYRSANSLVFQLNKRYITRHMSIFRCIDKRFETGEIFIKWDESSDDEWLILIYIKDNSPDKGIIIEDKTNEEKNMSHEFKANEIFKASDLMVDSLTQLISKKRQKQK